MTLSFVRPAVLRFALLDGQGEVVKCHPFAGPVKVAYESRENAQGAARMLCELGQGESAVYECDRPRGALRRMHFHLTRRLEDREVTESKR